jgi:hypothetical protein
MAGLAEFLAPGGDNWDRTSAGHVWERELHRIHDFTVTETHLALMRRMSVQWNWDDAWDWPAPCIACHRPYGNSNILSDVAEIAGIELDEDYLAGGNRPLRERLARLHAETAVALQIALVTGEFRSGRYLSGHYHRDWMRVADDSDGERERIILHLKDEHWLSVKPDYSPTLEELRAADPCRAGDH